jgi:genome maintenance exonuclease 1
MIWNKKFEYPPSTRSLVKGQRHYEIGVEKLPSVTTILSQTQPEEKKAKLAEWQRKVGKTEADSIRDQAAERGTIMHRIIEGYLTGERHADLSDLGTQAGVMAKTIWDQDLRDNMDEVWGTEVTVYYPGLYAGATDLVGVYNGAEIIGDFKQTNKPKRREWISDYFIQLAAYAMAHNYVYRTSIQSGVILMCSKDNIFQRFYVNPEEFKKYTFEWLRRVDLYYRNRDQAS